MRLPSCGNNEAEYSEIIELPRLTFVIRRVRPEYSINRASTLILVDF